MADEADNIDNILLRQLREMRARLDDVAAKVDAGFAETKQQFAQVNARLEAVEDGQTMTIGLLTQIRWRRERLERAFAHLANRITALEVHTGLVPTS